MSVPEPEALRRLRTSVESPLDPGIARYVEVLVKNGIETYESCQGGQGHSAPEPIVRFEGDRAEGYRAVAVALQHGFPVNELRRVWYVGDGEIEKPGWALTFWRPDFDYQSFLDQTKARRGRR